MKIQFFIQCMILVGIGIFIKFMAIYSMASVSVQILTVITGSIFGISGFILCARQYLKELKLGPVKFD